MPVGEKFQIVVSFNMWMTFSAASSTWILANCFKLLQEQLKSSGLCIVSDKIQTTTPIRYLGAIVDRPSSLKRYKLGEIKSLH